MTNKSAVRMVRLVLAVLLLCPMGLRPDQRITLSQTVGYPRK